MDDAPSAIALRESEELHRITLINMSDAVFITNDDGAFVYICPNVDVIFEYGHDEVQTMTGIAQLLGRDLVDRTQLARHGEGLRSMQERIRLVNGQLAVHTRKGEGTRIDARVPLRHER